MAKRIEDLDKNLKVKPAAAAGDVTWRSAADGRFAVRGLWWFKENGGRFYRLPMRAEKIVTPAVWDLQQRTAGARICFRSDTTSVHVRADLGPTVSFAHMPATGHSGFALYVGEPYRTQPWGFAFPQGNETSFERQLLANLSPRMREYTLYLPLYSGVKKLEIGLSNGARIEKPSAPAVAKPAVFYGTSITQGGCANTADADYASIVGRLLNIDTINLGFSGNGKGEPELAQLIGEIDASLVALDYVANVDVPRLRKTLPVFIRILREKRPELPIVIMSKIVYCGCSAHASARANHEAQRDTILECYARLRRAGDTNVHFVDGNALLPHGAWLAHSDGGHPTSVGFQLMAERLAPQIASILLAPQA